MPATVVVRPAGTSWMAKAGCRGATDIFFDPPGERREPRELREAEARAICHTCLVMSPCRTWAREHREYGFWGGESEEERAAAGFRADMPVGRIARYPGGEGKPVQARPTAPPGVPPSASSPATKATAGPERRQLTPGV
jgi:WhiB family redox-sensing transcriptional regulator